VSAWRGKIDDALLGPVLNKVFGDMVCGAQQQVEIKLETTTAHCCGTRGNRRTAPVS
jgi:hypothetical protein